MKGSRLSGEQILGILTEQQAWLSAVALCRKHGVSEPTLYKRRSKYCGMEAPDAKRLKALKAGERQAEEILAETRKE